jgi:hypothetical protein
MTFNKIVFGTNVVVAVAGLVAWIDWVFLSGEVTRVLVGGLAGYGVGSALVEIADYEA